MRLWWFILFSLVLVAIGLGISMGYKGIKENKVYSENHEITVLKDISYRDGDSNAWKLDLAMPKIANDELRPALVLIHGGNWAAGSKSNAVYQRMMKEYAEKGYVVINIDYRLLGEAAPPACIEDVKCAVRWLRAHADKYQVDPERIGSFGNSAGAHLSLMLGIVPESAGLEGDGGWHDFSSQVNAAAGAATPTRIESENPASWVKPWWPIGYISGDHPPLFLIQGTDDEMVRTDWTDDFVDKMKAAGADIEYLRLEDGTHFVAYTENLDITDPALENFFDRHLGKATYPDSSTNGWN